MNVVKHDPFLEDLAQLQRDTVVEGMQWVQELRKSAMQRYHQKGLPTIGDEEWRYTNLAPLRALTLKRLPMTPKATRVHPNLSSFSLKNSGAIELVFVDGMLVSELSAELNKLPSGLKILPILEACRTQRQRLEPFFGKQLDFDKQPLAAANAGLMQDGAFIEVRKNTTLNLPIHLMFWNSATTAGSANYPRNLIVVEELANVKVVESYLGGSEQDTLTNAVTEIYVGAQAHLEHTKVQREGSKAYHIGLTQIKQERDSRVTTHLVALGGKLNRNELHAALVDSGSDCTLNGVYLADDEQLIDNHTFIDHAMPNCSSHEFYKGILDGKARGVFRGKILVRPQAQKIDAKQSNSNLLLSDEAVINTKPQLEIYADDVKCTHGATIGRLDTSAIFYLRSRGIGEAEARSLLTFAFASDLVQRISIPELRQQLAAALWKKLPGNLDLSGALL